MHKFKVEDWPQLKASPSSVAIVAMGLSHQDFILNCTALGNSRLLADEIWAINSMGGILHYDRAFVMDDIENKLVPASKSAGTSNENGQLLWLKSPNKSGPVFTNAGYDDYPGTVDYPLEDVLNTVKFPYFNTSVAYAIAYALHIGVERISLFGCDFTYPNLHQGEQGRGCAEFWLGFAYAKGVNVQISNSSTLLDSNEPGRRIYGYAKPIVVHPRPNDATQYEVLTGEAASQYFIDQKKQEIRINL